jgi:ribosomal protein S6--L-glutamate ligase
LRIGVVTINPELKSSQRIAEAGRARGHDVLLLPLLKFSVSTGSQGLLHAGEPVPELDAAILRLGTQLPGLAVAVGRALESSGVHMLDPVMGLELARDKFETLRLLKSAGLPVPETELVRDLDQLEAAVERVGGAPVVIKPLHGSQGQGTILAESAAGAVSMMQSVLFQSREFLIQRYIPCAGEDIRVIVVNGEVVAAMRRKAPEGDFRSNLARGGSAAHEEVTAELGQLAVAATETLGLRCSGVDLLPGASGPVLLEVNGSPGLGGIEEATGMDVATSWIMALEKGVADST